MTWDEFVQDKKEHSLKEWSLTNIQCPVCGKEIYKYTFVTHAFYPPKRRYKCFGCNWEDEA